MNLTPAAVFFAAMLLMAPPFGSSQTVTPTANGNKAAWPVFRGPEMNNSARAGGILAPGGKYEFKLVWKRALGSGYSGISIFDDLGVTMFSDSVFDFITAFDPENGRERWRFKIDSTFLGRFGSQNGPISTPAIAQGQVFGLGPRGQLFALQGKTGRKLWLTHLTQDHAALAPFYGFSTSPLIYGNVLIVETGGQKNNAVTGFDKNTGRPLWTAGADTIEYQSPLLLSLHDRDQVLCAGNRQLFGIDPQQGRLLWQYAHGGDAFGIGSSSMVPLLIGENRLAIKNRVDGCALIEMQPEGKTWKPREIWKSKNIKGTYVPLIYHEGHIYGYNGRFLNCLEVNTGESVWKSRTPGDGFPLLLDGHLVIITKDGSLSLAPASATGYHEMASLKLFDHLVWTTPSFARGKIYVRSHTEMACVEIVPVGERMAGVKEKGGGLIPGSQFAQFISTVENAGDKKALIDEFLASHQRMPIIEGDRMVHFVYRGPATDMALVGDVTGFRVEQPMPRLAGSDLFYYSTYVEPDARVAYRFTKDFQERLPDPLNPNPTSRLTLFGESSVLGMPKWVEAKYADANNASTRGQIDSVSFTSALTDSSGLLKIYLPAGYHEGKDKYPVAYVHDGIFALSRGNVPAALDYLIGKTVAPVIVVFIPPFFGGGYDEYNGSFKEQNARMCAEEIVPLIDRTYRTLPAPEYRANWGTSFSAVTAFYLTFTYPENFGKAAMQSIFWDLEELRKHEALIANAEARQLALYLDWGRYDFNSPLEGFEIRPNCIALAKLLKEKGFEIQGGEVNEGYGWLSWRNRTGKVFESLYPLTAAPGKPKRAGRE